MTSFLALKIMRKLFFLSRVAKHQQNNIYTRHVFNLGLYSWLEKKKKKVGKIDPRTSK